MTFWDASEPRTYAVLELASPTFSALSNGNLTVTRNNTTVRWDSGVSTIGVSSGKWYFEVHCDSGAAVNAGTSRHAYGVGQPLGSPPSEQTLPGFGTGSVGYLQSNGNKFYNGASTAYGTAYAVGDVIGVAFDVATGKVWFSKNGTWQNSGDPAAGTGQATTITVSNPVRPQIGLYYSGSSIFASATVNFGASAFSYTPPAGFNAGVYTVP
jgi:hypothetical protein